MKAGDKFRYNGGDVRVMAVAENWAMVRRPGCVPFCLYVKDLVLPENEPIPGSSAGCWYCGMPKGSHAAGCPEEKK